MKRMLAVVVILAGFAVLNASDVRNIPVERREELRREILERMRENFEKQGIQFNEAEFYFSQMKVEEAGGLSLQKVSAGSPYIGRANVIYEWEPNDVPSLNDPNGSANSMNFGDYVKGDSKKFFWYDPSWKATWYCDSDFFHFTAPASAVCHIEAYCRRLKDQSSFDTWVTLFDQALNQLGSNDDYDRSFYGYDSSLEVVLPYTGTYYVMITNRQYVADGATDPGHYILYVGYWGPNRVRGEVFHDVNNNGVRDEGEPGLADK
ncbi:MAG: PPC domain-containing protein, partial [candidate division KSB1 bacterium]|nr:PPC domain-containing protein [candidate division KSB1 bacterium]